MYSRRKAAPAHCDVKWRRFLDKAAVIRQRDFIPSIQADPLDPEKRTSLKVSPWRLCGVAQVEEVKLLVRVMPIWIFSLMFMVHITQITSFFLRQGLSMDLSMGPNFKIPAASLTIFNSLTAILCIPLYNEYFVPLMRRITGNERGISMLQRIGTGLVLTTVAMIVAAVVENERLEVVREHGLEDQPAVAVPMSAFWLLPQYMIFGVSEVFVMIGQYEFFYDQAPDDMQSIGTALYMSNTGVAHFLCTAILKIVVSVTSNGGRSGWIVNNLNRCRIDKYYWMLAALGAANFVCYVVVARWYTYKKAVRQYWGFLLFAPSINTRPLSSSIFTWDSLRSTWNSTFNMENGLFITDPARIMRQLGEKSFLETKQKNITVQGRKNRLSWTYVSKSWIHLFFNLNG